jgi:uncharacterized protein (TIGR02266 family)
MRESAECRAIAADDGNESQPVSSGRRSSRKSVELELTLESESNFYVGLTENFSKGGVFIATHMTERVGTEIDVTLKLMPLETMMRAGGTVRWVREFSQHSEAPAGMGVQLEALGSEDLALIEAFAGRRAPIFFEVD